MTEYEVVFFRDSNLTDESTFGPYETKEEAKDEGWKLMLSMDLHGSDYEIVEVDNT